MSKLVLLLSLLGIGILLIFGIVSPDSPVMWMASTSDNFTWLRVAMIIILLSLLFTHPPRNVYLRAVVGAIAVTVSGWALFETYANHMELLDTLSLLEVSVTTGITVLEREPEIKVPFPGYAYTMSRRV